MIFLTVGTQLPFDRLVRAVDLWAGSRGRRDIFGQISDPGPSGYRPKNFDWVPDLAPAEFEARFQAASHIVAHAGMGTIISALGEGKPLLIMPRRAHLGEQRNDHQHATAERFGTRASILAALDEDELPEKMDMLVASTVSGAHEGAAGAAATSIGRFADRRLTDRIRSMILD